MDMGIINRQWSSRPDDERFVSLIDLHNANLKAYRSSQQGIMLLSDLVARPCDENPETDMELVTPRGTRTGMSNWAFRQLANKLECQPAFLSRMPASLSSQVVNWGLKNNGNEKMNLLVTKEDEGGYNLRAFTSETYGRIWDHQISAPLVERFGNGVDDTDWTVPGEFGVPLKQVTKANTTLYRGDRDFFVALVDEKNKIEVPNRRDGKSVPVARGFIVTNSEVGSGVLAIYFFTFDYICMNRNIWGLDNITEIKIRHSKFAPERWLDEIAPAIEQYGQIAASRYENQIILAQNSKLPKPADEFLKEKLALPQVTDKLVKQITISHMEEEKRPIETLFDASVAVSAFAKSIPYQNERVILERASGKFLAMAS